MRTHAKFPAFILLANVGLWFSQGAYAHTFGAHGAGFIQGLAHPFLGLDHAVAMVAVGLWGVQRGGAALWRLPLTFLLVMALSAMLAGSGQALPWLETAIGSSVIFLGLLIAFAKCLPSLLSLLVVGLFASFHGFAHGLEMPQATSPMGYGLGFCVATASLHLFGIMLGLSLRRAPLLARIGGMAIMAAGIYAVAV
jgi:urease accessory protein